MTSEHTVIMPAYFVFDLQSGWYFMTCIALRTAAAGGTTEGHEVLDMQT